MPYLSPSAIGPVRRRPRKRYLGQTAFSPATSAGFAELGPAGNFSDFYQAYLSPPPGTNLSSLAYNAATGNLSAAQVAALQQQEEQSLVAAGAAPADAATQSAGDVTDTLQSFTGPGAFGVTETGALPGSPTVFSSALDSSSSLWLWLAVGGVALLIFMKER